MVAFIVIEKKLDGKHLGLGEHEFRSAPRVGEHIIMNDNNGIGQAYEVIAVLHPLDPGSNAGDLIIRHISTDVDFRKSV